MFLLIFLLFTVPSNGANLVKIANEFVEQNSKMQSIKKNINAIKLEKISSIFGDLKLASAKIASTKDIKNKKDWRIPYFEFNAQFSPLILAEVQTLSLKHDQNIEKYINEGEKVLKEYLRKLAVIKMKKEQLKTASKYMEGRRIDIQEAKARSKYGDISFDELKESESNLKSSEADHQNLIAEIEDLEIGIQLFNPKNYEKIEIDSILFIDTYDLSVDDLEEAVNLFEQSTESSDLISSKLRLESASAGTMVGLLGPITPKFTFSTELFLENEKNLNENYKNKISIGVFFDISPKTFLQMYESSEKYEAAKLDYVWEKNKYEYDVNQNLLALRNKKNNLLAAKSHMEAKETILNSMLAQFANGMVPYSKITQARNEHYNSVERYYKVYDDYVKTLLEYMLTKGIVRKLFERKVNPKGAK